MTKKFKDALYMLELISRDRERMDRLTRSRAFGAFEEWIRRNYFDVEDGSNEGSDHVRRAIPKRRARQGL